GTWRTSLKRKTSGEHEPGASVRWQQLRERVHQRPPHLLVRLGANLAGFLRLFEREELFEEAVSRTRGVLFELGASFGRLALLAKQGEQPSRDGQGREPQGNPSSRAGAGEVV